MLNRKQAKEKRRIFLHFSLACLHHPDHLFPEKNKSVIQDFVVMIVSEQPVMKPCSFFDFLQIICQGIMGIAVTGRKKRPGTLKGGNDAMTNSPMDLLLETIFKAMPLAAPEHEAPCPDHGFTIL